MATTDPHRMTVEIAERTRADAAVAKTAGISRTRAVNWIQRGLVLVNDREAGKSTKLVPGDTLIVNPPNDPDPLEVKAELVQDLHVIADEEHYVVVDKPVGVAAHPSQGWRGPTVVGGLAALGIDTAPSGQPERRGIVQRLDVGTSGLVVVAQAVLCCHRLRQSVHLRTPHRKYHLLIEGLPPPLNGPINALIVRHPAYDWRFAVVAGR